MEKEYHYISCKATRRSIVSGSEQRSDGLRVFLDINKPYTTKEMCEDISHAQSLTVPDMVGALDSLSRAVGTALRSGRTVEVDGLGTFQLSIGTATPKHAGEKVRSRDICVKGITFRPSKELLAQLEDVHFTVEKYEEAPLKDDEAVSQLRTYFADESHGGIITVRKLATLTNSSYSTAYARTKRFVERGVLKPCPYARHSYNAGPGLE